MKTLTDQIQESLVAEHADNTYKQVFDKEIVFSNKLKSLFSKLKMDFRHVYDSFRVYSDGCLQYRNEKLFTGEIMSKVRKMNLNRSLSPGSITFLYMNTTKGELDMSIKPEQYMRAIYDALTHRTYHIEDGRVVIDEIDYNEYRFEVDKKDYEEYGDD